MDSSELIASIGLDCTDGRCVNLFTQLELPAIDLDSDETSFYLIKADLGIAFELSEGTFFEEVYERPSNGSRFLVSSVALTSETYGEGYGTFAGELPSGLRWDMTVADVSAVLGPPAEEDQESKRLTVYWRKKNGLDYVGAFSKTGQLQHLNVGLANALV